MASILASFKSSYSISLSLPESNGGLNKEGMERKNARKKKAERERERERERKGGGRKLTFYDDKYSNLVRLPLVLHVQHTCKLQRQQKCFIKVVYTSNLEGPDIDEPLPSVVPTGAIVVKIFKAGEKQ